MDEKFKTVEILENSASDLYDWLQKTKLSGIERDEIQLIVSDLRREIERLYNLSQIK